MFMMLLSKFKTDHIFVNLLLDSLEYSFELFFYLYANNHILLVIVALSNRTVALQ